MNIEMLKTLDDDCHHKKYILNLYMFRVLSSSGIFINQFLILAKYGQKTLIFLDD